MPQVPRSVRSNFVERFSSKSSLSANKIEIKQAIEELFDVKVADVHTQIIRGKEKRVGRYVGRRSNWKRAIVTLSKGQKLEFFEGV